jgi:hypothetical protein
MKLKDYIKKLEELGEKYPSSLEMEVIYSHDDEGNEYQKVINDEPSMCQIESLTDGYRFLELVGFYVEKAVFSDDIALEDCNAVCIN